MSSRPVLFALNPAALSPRPALRASEALKAAQLNTRCRTESERGTARGKLEGRVMRLAGFEGDQRVPV